MTDSRDMLADIRDKFDAMFNAWIKREKGNAQHAVDMTEHRADLDALMLVLCENYDSLCASYPTASKEEIDSPGR
jgi:hypothetical protein